MKITISVLHNISPKNCSKFSTDFAIRDHICKLKTDLLEAFGENFTLEDNNYWYVEGLPGKNF